MIRLLNEPIRISDWQESSTGLERFVCGIKGLVENIPHHSRLKASSCYPAPSQSMANSGRTKLVPETLPCQLLLKLGCWDRWRRHSGRWTLESRIQLATLWSSFSTGSRWRDLMLQSSSGAALYMRRREVQPFRLSVGRQREPHFTQSARHEMVKCGLSTTKAKETHGSLVSKKTSTRSKAEEIFFQTCPSHCNPRIFS